MHKTNEYLSRFPAYAASTSWLPGAGPTDVAQFLAGVLPCWVFAIYVSAAQVTNTTAVFRLLHRSSAATGGTPVVVSSSPNDTGNPPPTGVLSVFTAPPVVGALVGVRRTTPVTISGGAVSSNFVEWPMGVSPKRGVRIGPGESLCVSASGLTNATMYLTIEWVEITSNPKYP